MMPLRLSKNGMTHIIKFDPERTVLEELRATADQLREILPKDDMLIVLPYGVDLLMDVPVDELIVIRNHLNEIINSRSFS